MNAITITCLNYRGEVSDRRIQVMGPPYRGSTEWHPEVQWLLPAIDVDRGVERTFAMEGMLIHNPQDMPLITVVVELAEHSIVASTWDGATMGRDKLGAVLRVPESAQEVPSSSYASRAFHMVGRLEVIAGKPYLAFAGGNIWKLPDSATISFVPDSEAGIIKHSHIGRLTAAGVEHIDLTERPAPTQPAEPLPRPSILGRIFRRLGFALLVVSGGYLIAVSPIGGVAAAHMKPAIESGR